MLSLASPLLAMQTFNRGLNELPRELRGARRDRARDGAHGAGLRGARALVVPRDPAAVARRIAAVPGVVSRRGPGASSGGRLWLVDARIAAQAESIPARAHRRPDP